MPFTIALAGKGGTGKTTISGIMIKYLLDKKKIPILAVDADANANLNEVLGVEISRTLSDAREEMKNGEVPRGMTKNTFMSMKLEESIIENSNFDLLVMGQPEGSGCYCAANTLLSNFLDKLIKNYPYTLIDNEAGMEHISRLTVKKIDLLLIISDSSKRSIKSGIRINELTNKLNLEVSKKMLIINRVKPSFDIEKVQLSKNTDLKLLGLIPEDKEIYKYELTGMPIININKKNNVIKAAYNLFDNMF